MRETPIEYTFLNDHWAYPLEARLRSLAVHRVLVDRLPWEKVLFGAEAPIEGMPQTAMVDQELLVDCKNLRTTMQEALARYPEASTFAEWINIMSSQCSHLQEAN